MTPTLLSLPAEIRLMIWDSALPDRNEPRVIHHPPPFNFNHQSSADPWALYRTCRSIRNELSPIISKGITLVLHVHPWQKPADMFSGPRSHGSDILRQKFLRMAPYIECLRISGTRLCMPEDRKACAPQLRRLVEQAPMPRLRRVELQPRGWGISDWALAFQLVNSLGLGQQDISFLAGDGRYRNVPPDLRLMPEWMRLRRKADVKSLMPQTLAVPPPQVAV